MSILILLCMFFMHIVDDYYLQGILASMKQKSWWEKNAPDPLYKNDYKMALVEHAFSWTFMMMLPIIVYTAIIGTMLPIWFIIIFFFLNATIHALVDNAKANAKIINLIQDQSIHFIQIICTWLALGGCYNECLRHLMNLLK